MNSEDFVVLASGMVERIGLKGTLFQYKRYDCEKTMQEVVVKDTKQAVHLISTALCDPKLGVMRSLEEVMAIGHRVVHGGEKMVSSVLINKQVKSIIKEYSRRAPHARRAVRAGTA